MAEFDPYLGEIRFFGSGANDFVDVVLDNGADPSAVTVVVYNQNGSVRSTNSLGATPDSSTAGSDVYLVEAAIHKNGAVALLVDGNVVSFLSFHQSVTATEGPAAGLTSTELGANGPGESFVTSDHGATYEISDTQDPGVIPCFLAGTLITTPGGPVAAETLRAGDEVITYDFGRLHLAWVGHRRLTPELTAQGVFYPVCIPRGALGTNEPSRDLYVSPNHRVHLVFPQFQVLFGTREVLVPARALIGHNGIRVATEQRAPHYVHLLFERHELVFSEGQLTESFYPHVLGARGFDRTTRDELYAIFPELKVRPHSYGPTSRLCLKAHEAKLARAVLRDAA